MRLTPTSTYTQSFNPNTQASFTPTNNKSIEKNVQAPSQRTGAQLTTEYLEQLFQFLKPPSEVPFPKFSPDPYHRWAKLVSEHFNNTNYEKLGYFWTDVARIIDPKSHITLTHNIISFGTSSDPRLSMNLEKASLDTAKVQWLQEFIDSGVIHIENPNSKTPTVSVKLTGDSASDGDKLEVFARLLDALQLEAEKTPSA
ncbi:MAG: hypothetical protein ACK551_00165 [Vampirovibrionales bacterium]